MAAPTRPPSGSELLVYPLVIQALVEAWADSQVNDPISRHEEGGWIYMDLSSGETQTRRASRGTRNRLSLGNPVLLPNHASWEPSIHIRIQLRKDG
jgi:hypothetical protein